MTTFSGVISKSGFAAVKSERQSFHKLNLTLLLLLILATMSYVFMANLLVAQKYSLNLRRSELNALNSRPVPSAGIEAPEDLEALLLFAQNLGMIEAKDIDSILQDRNFALEGGSKPSLAQ